MTTKNLIQGESFKFHSGKICFSSVNGFFCKKLLKEKTMKAFNFLKMFQIDKKYALLVSLLKTTMNFKICLLMFPALKRW